LNQLSISYYVMPNINSNDEMGNFASVKSGENSQP